MEFINNDIEDDYERDELGNIVYYALRPNKTKLKKEIADLFAVGEQMTKLSSEHLAELHLPEKIYDAVIQASVLPLNNSRKRLLKYIAGQLHKIDYLPIVEELARLQNKNAHAIREHHLAERWRDRLLTEGQDALTDLFDDYPHADRQTLRQLVRNAQKEQTQNKPPKSARLLYRQLKTLLTVPVVDELFADELITDEEQGLFVDDEHELIDDDDNDEEWDDLDEDE